MSASGDLLSEVARAADTQEIRVDCSKGIERYFTS